MTCLGIMASGVNVGSDCTDVLLEPFDNLTAWSKSGSPTIDAGGRTGNFVRVPFFDRITYAIPAISQLDTVILGFAVRLSNAGIGGDFVSLRSDTAGTAHVQIQNTNSGSTGNLRVVHSGSISTLAQTGFVIASNTWYYVEVQVKLHDTLGSVTLRLNGVQQGSVFTGDTKNGGTKTVFDAVRCENNQTGNVDLDDLYLSTGAGCGFKGAITIP